MGSWAVKREESTFLFRKIEEPKNRSGPNKTLFDSIPANNKTAYGDRSFQNITSKIQQQNGRSFCKKCFQTCLFEYVMMN